ncbi:hypothetical protein L6452_08291 [Arctium lappa]|uniref:Uncharacterized protein n=1 Tax=Arctium lappa TaxID=4217 RepID=A0ACB9DHA6_ARCLA|nr:hypothetical protein L6452_08291 [Arctium lappa]
MGFTILVVASNGCGRWRQKGEASDEDRKGGWVSQRKERGFCDVVAGPLVQWLNVICSRHRSVDCRYDFSINGIDFIYNVTDFVHWFPSIAENFLGSVHRLVPRYKDGLLNSWIRRI